MKLYNKIKLRLIRVFNPRLYLEIQARNSLKFKQIMEASLKKRADEIFMNIINNNSLLDKLQRKNTLKE